MVILLLFIIIISILILIKMNNTKLIILKSHEFRKSQNKYFLLPKQLLFEGVDRRRSAPHRRPILVVFEK